MKVYLKKVPNLEIPKQATEGSAAFDILCSEEPTIIGEKVDFPLDGLTLYKTINYLQYNTNIQICPENKNIFCFLMPRSSISNKNLAFKNSVGLIDTDYTGRLIIRMSYIPDAQDFFFIQEGGFQRAYIKINSEKIYHKSDKLAQLLFLNKIPIEFEMVDVLPETKRGENGFGHSDKK